jgi:hypothetical protein
MERTWDGETRRGCNLDATWTRFSIEAALG